MILADGTILGWNGATLGRAPAGSGGTASGPTTEPISARLLDSNGAPVVGKNTALATNSRHNDVPGYLPMATRAQRVRRSRDQSRMWRRRRRQHSRGMQHKRHAGAVTSSFIGSNRPTSDRQPRSRRDPTHPVARLAWISRRVSWFRMMGNCSRSAVGRQAPAWPISSARLMGRRLRSLTNVQAVSFSWSGRYVVVATPAATLGDPPQSPAPVDVSSGTVVATATSPGASISLLPSQADAREFLTVEANAAGSCAVMMQSTPESTTCVAWHPVLPAAPSTTASRRERSRHSPEQSLARCATQL